MFTANTSCAIAFRDSSLKNQWFVTLLTLSRVVRLTQGLDPSDRIVTISYRLPGGEGDILFLLDTPAAGGGQQIIVNSCSDAETPHISFYKQHRTLFYEAQ